MQFHVVGLSLLLLSLLIMLITSSKQVFILGVLKNPLWKKASTEPSFSSVVAHTLAIGTTICPALYLLLVMQFGKNTCVFSKKNMFFFREKNTIRKKLFFFCITSYFILLMHAKHKYETFLCFGLTRNLTSAKCNVKQFTALIPNQERNIKSALYFFNEQMLSINFFFYKECSLL